MGNGDFWHPAASGGAVGNRSRADLPPPLQTQQICPHCLLTPEICAELAAPGLSPSCPRVSGWPCPSGGCGAPESLSCLMPAVGTPLPGAPGHWDSAGRAPVSDTCILRGIPAVACPCRLFKRPWSAVLGEWEVWAVADVLGSACAPSKWQQGWGDALAEVLLSSRLPSSSRRTSRAAAMSSAGPAPT